MLTSVISYQHFGSWQILTTIVGCSFFFLQSDAKSLAWSSTEQQFKAKTGDSKVVATYNFKNTGSAPVRIISVTSTCICTTGRPSKDIYAPGEAGELTVEFVVGPQEGHQERPISVVTDDGPEEPTVLTIVVDIDDLVSLQPKFLFWNTGQIGEEKVVTVSLAAPGTARPLTVRGGHVGFASRLEKTDVPGEFRIWIKPASTGKPIQAVLYLDTVIDGVPRSFAIFAAVK